MRPRPKSFRCHIYTTFAPCSVLRHIAPQICSPHFALIEWDYVSMPVFTTVMLLRLLAILTLAIPISALAQPPNIVVIMSDDQPDVETLSTLPILRREMVLKGVTFKNSFVDFSLCCPSRSSFLTGLGAHNHHVLNNTADLDGG